MVLISIWLIYILWNPPILESKNSEVYVALYIDIETQYKSLLIILSINCEYNICLLIYLLSKLTFNK